MENRQVGLLVLGISLLMILIVIIFNSALQEIVNASCSLVGHGDSCPMYNTIERQTLLSLSIVGVLIILGFFLIFSKPEERIVIKKFKDKKKKMDLTGLDPKERETMEILEKENGTVFQADLMEKLGIGKVGITRLLDKLEAKQLIERKRRGMSNVVVLKN